MKKLFFFLAFISLETNAASIKDSECQEMKSKLGQLFYINVDGFGSNHTIHPAYERLIKKIQPGGVLPHYNSKDIGAIKTASHKLQAQSDLPLMIGIDYQSVNGTEIGLGWGTGLADKLAGKDASCFEKVGKIEAALHQYAGINNPLGPTIEYNLKSENGFASQDLEYKKERLAALIGAFRDAGLETTLKHFPYTPADYNLHKTSKDTKIPVSEVDSKYLPIYKEFTANSGMVMTTHLFNSEVDPSNMATFSKIWMNKLRNEVGFKGIVMTDALFMINSYPETMKQMSRDWPQHLAKDFSKDLSRFSIKSILAGHDMVFLETAAKETEETYNDVARFACTDDKLAEEFRKRVRESHERITTYKKANPQLKLKNSALTPAEVTKLIEARKKGSNLCQDNFSELEKIVQKTKGTKTIIDESVFCDPFNYTEGNLSIELKKMDQNINVEVVKALIVGGMDHPDDFNASINYLEKNADIKSKIYESLKRDFYSDDKDKKLNTLNTLARLGLLGKESEIIDDLVMSDSYDMFKRYMELTQTNSLATTSDKVPLNKRLSLFERYIAENPLDLSNPKINVDHMPLNETLFPHSFYENLSEDEIRRISPKGDAGILFKARRVNYGMNYTPEEAIRLAEVFIKNANLADYVLNASTCNNFQDGKCTEIASFQVDISYQAISLKASELKSMSEEKRQELLTNINSQINTAGDKEYDRYKAWELKKLQLKIKDDKNETLKVADDILLSTIKNLKSGDTSNFSNSNYNLSELKELLTPEESAALKNKIIAAVKENWKPEFIYSDEIKEFVENYPEEFKQELKGARRPLP